MTEKREQKQKVTDGRINGRFAPGVSGNPAGRPKKKYRQKELEEMCRALTPEALEVVCEVMRDRSETRRLLAAKTILEYAYGKPRQVTVLKSDEDGDGIITLHAVLDPRAKIKDEPEEY